MLSFHMILSQRVLLWVPDIFTEGAIKLALGKTHLVIYAMEDGKHGSDFLIPSRDGKLDLEAENSWKEYGVDFM